MNAIEKPGEWVAHRAVNMMTRKQLEREVLAWREKAAKRSEEASREPFSTWQTGRPWFPSQVSCEAHGVFGCAECRPAEPIWSCRCGYQNAGGVCTKCGSLPSEVPSAPEAPYGDPLPSAFSPLLSELKSVAAGPHGLP